MSQSSEWEDIKPPPYAGLYFLVILAWIFFSIFRGLDPNKWFFLGSMIIATGLSTYYIIYAKTSDEPLQQGSVIFFILSWLGIWIFSDRSSTATTLPKWAEFLSVIELQYIFQIQLLVLLPVVLVWMIPYTDERFFGLKDISEDTKNKSIWKFSVLLILLINILDLPRFTEILVVLPLFREHYLLYKNSKQSLPLLTLHVQKELANKFAVPISMTKAILLVMTTFIFELILSQLWMLIILLYIGLGFLWLIDFLVPLSEQDGKESEIEEQLKEFGKSIQDEMNVQNVEKVKSSIKKSINKQMDVNKPITVNVNSVKEENIDVEIIPTEKQQLQDPDMIPSSIGEKAHALGKKVRTELQKPQYNLNHILSTLSQEDFSTGYRVQKEGLEFNSTEGKWSPPKDLILFPIELEEYDFRRVDEILLLGFNKPINSKQAKINFDFGENSKYNTKISGDQIQIGDTTFNMKTLVLSRDQWMKTKSQLEIIDDLTDISYTGFDTLQELQTKLTEISDKWIQLRKHAEEAAVNFLAGLLGSSDPIFLGKKDVTEQLIEASDDYVVEDVDESNNL